MIFNSIIIILTAFALPSIHISPLLLTRCGSLTFLAAGVVAANTLNVSAMGPGISLYNGIIQVTPMSQTIDIFICLVTCVILGLIWPVYRIYRNSKYIPTSVVKIYQPTVAQSHIVIILISAGLIILVSCTSFVTIFLGIAVQYYAVKILVSRYPGGAYNYIKTRNMYFLTVINYTYLSQTISTFDEVSGYQVVHIVFLVYVGYELCIQILDIFFWIVEPLIYNRYLVLYFKNSVYIYVPRWVYIVCFYITINLIFNAPLLCMNQSLIDNIIDVATQTDCTDTIINENTQPHATNPVVVNNEIPINGVDIVTPGGHASGNLNVIVDPALPAVMERPVEAVAPGTVETVNPIISFFKDVYSSFTSCCSNPISDSGSMYEMEPRPAPQDPPVSARTETTFPSDLSRDTPSFIDIVNRQATRVFRAMQRGVSEEVEASIYQEHIAERYQHRGITPTDNPSAIDQVRRLRSYGERPR